MKAMKNIETDMGRYCRNGEILGGGMYGKSMS